MDFSVVIPAHNDDAGAYFTATAALSDLEHGNISHEVIVAVDGAPLPAVTELAKTGAIRTACGDFGGPQNARHAGIMAAEAKYVFCLDSHVIPSRHFFTHLAGALVAQKAAIVHSPHYTWGKKQGAYGFGINWAGNLWSVDHETHPQSFAPYRVAMMGHGAFVVNKEKYLACGGYWSEQHGWGGEEPHLNLKFWMLGETCWCDPRVYHWHYMGHRRDASVFKDREHVRNFMLAAYAIGGRKYLDICYTHYTLIANAQPSFEQAKEHWPTDPYGDIYSAVPVDAAAERERIMAGPYAGDLDALRSFFRSENIPN